MNDPILYALAPIPRQNVGLNPTGRPRKSSAGTRRKKLKRVKARRI